ncbi:MAG: shikimate dehydrogenase [Syntrophomonadaceae bacterium]|jgi:shikimate dehydrogenase
MEINVNTIYLGLLGNPVGHSLSPRLHNAVFADMGINALYLPFALQASQLEQALYGLQSLGFRGVNVTIPFKEAVVPYMDELSVEARDCGAVNVIDFKNNKMIGHNTDGAGFIQALHEADVAVNGRTVILGAGGAARSIVAALARAGMNEILIFDIEAQRAQHLASLIPVSSGTSIRGRLLTEADFSRSARESNLIINCSPVGMYPQVDAAPIETLKSVQPHSVIVDIIYNPEETRFLQSGHKQGCKTLNGVPMFVHQAALTLQILLGINPDIEFMKEVVRHSLKE